MAADGPQRTGRQVPAAMHWHHCLAAAVANDDVRPALAQLIASEATKDAADVTCPHERAVLSGVAVDKCTRRSVPFVSLQL